MLNKLINVNYSLFHRYKNQTKAKLDEEKKKIQILLINDSPKEYNS